MKKMMFVLLLIVSIGFLAAVESAPSSVVGYVKYPCLTGLNLVALPMNTGFVVASDVANAYPGMMDAINYWDAVGQQWIGAYDLGGFWDPDFAVMPGDVLFINALADFNFFSLGAMPATQASYTLLTGLNTMMIPLNQSAITLASELGTAVGTLDAINYWDAASQQWIGAYDLGGFWDPDFALAIGNPLFVSSLADGTWPVRGRANTNLRSRNN